MPPRRAVQAGNEKPTPSAPGRTQDVSEEVQKSLARWSDEQEIALLKAIVRWKPVGMHKHSRMIAIHDYMIAQGVVSSDDEHTTIPGIWTKLGSLYNLPILDEREDSMLSNSSDENTSPGEVYSPYELPDDKRGNLDESKSPALLDSRRESTITNTDSPASSPAPGRRGGRATRRGGRVSKLQQEVGSSSSGRRSTSKAGSTADGDEPMGDAADEEDVVDEDGGGEAEQSPKPRSARARGSLRSKGGRGPAGRRASTRARGRKK